MSVVNIFFFIYGVLLLGGGYMGYKKAGSKISLIMGVVSGVFIFMGIYLSQNNAKCGYTTIAVISAILILAFLKRLLKTKKFMPSGMLLILSTAVLAVALIQIF